MLIPKTTQAADRNSVVSLLLSTVGFLTLLFFISGSVFDLCFAKGYIFPLLLVLGLFSILIGAGLAMEARKTLSKKWPILAVKLSLFFCSVSVLMLILFIVFSFPLGTPFPPNLDTCHSLF